MRGRQLTYYVFDHDVLAAKADFRSSLCKSDQGQTNEKFFHFISVDWIISVLTVVAERATVIPLIPPYAVGFVSFLVFVVWNGGIVLGQSVSNSLATLFT